MQLTLMIAFVGTNHKAIQVHHSHAAHSAYASKRAVLKSA